MGVEYSSLNYKDGMAVTGSGKIVRRFPMVPGIDFAGRVIESASERFQTGDPVILTGWGVGESHWGGYAQRARVSSDWLVPIPEVLDARKAMIIGTAGLTAMLCVMTLQEAGVTPEQGPILITGAAGGVGSVSVSLLSRLGYRVSAVTGRESTHAYLTGLGAAEIITRVDIDHALQLRAAPRSGHRHIPDQGPAIQFHGRQAAAGIAEEMNQPSQPLETQRWAGAIDTVGGPILARTLAEMAYNGAVAACGLAADFRLETTVMPFILRNVSLRGVDSVSCPLPRRTEAWRQPLTAMESEAKAVSPR
ncbi:MAG: MDR family oxidoreductase [Candidatus Sedimenticola endophacoides]